jgi:hypothetical protein
MGGGSGKNSHLEIQANPQGIAVTAVTQEYLEFDRPQGLPEAESDRFVRRCHVG